VFGTTIFDAALLQHFGVVLKSFVQEVLLQFLSRLLPAQFLRLKFKPETCFERKHVVFANLG
jgi:hypothetical protein